MSDLCGRLTRRVVSIGDVVKDHIRQMGQQISFLETYIKGHGAAGTDPAAPSP